MLIDFFGQVITADDPSAILAACYAARPAFAPGELRLVVRSAEGLDSDLYAMRGCVHSGYAVSDGQTYRHIWLTDAADGPDAPLDHTPMSCGTIGCPDHDPNTDLEAR